MAAIRLIAVAVVLPPLALVASAPAALAQSAAPRDSEDLHRLQQQALEEGEAGKTEVAIRDYTRALQLQPEWKEGLWNLGTLEYGANRFAEAQSTFQKVVAFAPDLSMAWALLGLSEFETKHYSEALDHLARANSLGVNDDAEVERVAKYHLALLMIRADEFERASDLLLVGFGSGLLSPQVKFALGLTMLRVPLLPEQVNPSQEALVLAAGSVGSTGTEAVRQFPALLQSYPAVPYLHYGYGLDLAKAGRDREAMVAMREEMKVSPASPLPWIEIARLQLRLGAPKEAMLAAQEAIKLAPGDRNAHAALAKAYEAAGDKKQAETQQKVAAEIIPPRNAPERRILQRYANANPELAAASRPDQQRWNQAMQEYSSGDFQAAAADLKEWLRATPENGTGWAVLGLSEFGLKDYDNALIHLDRGATLGLSGSSESLQSARYTYGILLIRAGQFERASEVLVTASGTGALAARVEYAMGLALLRKADLPGAESEDKSAMIASAGKIALLLQQSRYDEAFVQFKPLLAQHPTVPFLHYAYGTALLALSEFDEAAAAMRAEIAISPGSELPCIRLASISLREHKPAEAIQWSQRALRLTPESVEAHYLLGRAALEAGDESTALHELELASRLSPGSPEVHFNLAKAYARARMSEKANQERATFSQLNALAESQRSQHGSQVYSGPHDAGEVSTAPSTSAAPAAP